MSFRIRGLSAEPFRHLFGQPDEDLRAQGVIPMIAEADSGFPDRIEMRDALPGERMLLLNHVCQPADSPYRATHAIFVRDGAEDTFDAVDEIPEVMRTRLLSLRGFDEAGMIREAEVVEGTEAEGAIARLFALKEVAYIHAHNAGHGCFSGRIDRA